MSEKISQRQKEIIALMKSSQDLILKFFEKKREKLIQLSEIVYSKDKMEHRFKIPISKLEKMFNDEQLFEMTLMENNQVLINDILIRYQNISGISIEKTKEKYLKITFHFIKDNNYYIILSVTDNSVYNIIEVCPQTLNAQSYLKELNLTKNLTLFLVKLINKEILSNMNNNSLISED